MARRRRPVHDQPPTDTADGPDAEGAWEPPPPSKTRRKREAEALQQLGKQLTELNDQQLGELPLGADLHKAILENRRLKKNEARRRHMQYIGKLMREVDIEALQAGLDRFDASSVVFQKLQHDTEAWRDRLLGDDGAAALSDFFDAHPDADRQQVRQLVGKARDEAARNAELPEGRQPLKAAGRKLFRALRDVLG